MARLPVAHGSRRADSMLARLAALEERVTCLEEQRSPGGMPPKKETAPPQPSGPRCPGCHLELGPPQNGRCAWCGFVLDAVEDNVDNP